MDYESYIFLSTPIPKAEVATIICTMPEMKSFWFSVLSLMSIFPWKALTEKPSCFKRAARVEAVLVRAT